MMNAPTPLRCACLSRRGPRCRREGVESFTVDGSAYGFPGRYEIFICETHLRAVRQGIEPRLSADVFRAQSWARHMRSIYGDEPPTESEAPVVAAPSRAKERPAVSPAPVVKVKSRNWAQLDWCEAV